MSNERIHHPFSPSSLQSREACPKFQNRDSTNEAAILGTIQHYAVDRGEDDNRLSDNRAAAVANCMAFTEERAFSFPGGQILKEVYLPVDDEVVAVEVIDAGKKSFIAFQGTTAGYLDWAIVSADKMEAEIVDYKFGLNVVTDAKSNLQGISYMLGLKKLFPTLKKCRVIFVQPHIDETSEHTFDLTNSDELYLRVRTVVGRAVEAAKSPDDYSAARPNVGTCLFCALVGKCPAVAKLAIQVGQKFKPLSIPDNITPTTISNPAGVDMGIRLADVVKTWAEAFRRQATEKTIENPDFIPEGYVLVSSRKRKILDARKFADAAKAFLPENAWGEIEKLFDIPIGPVEDLISVAAARGSKEKTVDEFGARVLDAGIVELGLPFASLRQSKKPGEGKIAAK